MSIVEKYLQEPIVLVVHLVLGYPQPEPHGAHVQLVHASHTVKESLLANQRPVFWISVSQFEASISHHLSKIWRQYILVRRNSFFKFSSSLIWLLPSSRIVPANIFSLCLAYFSTARSSLSGSESDQVPRFCSSWRKTPAASRFFRSSSPSVSLMCLLLPLISPLTKWNRMFS